MSIFKNERIVPYGKVGPEEGWKTEKILNILIDPVPENKLNLFSDLLLQWFGVCYDLGSIRVGRKGLEFVVF